MSDKNDSESDGNSGEYSDGDCESEEYDEIGDDHMSDENEEDYMNDSETKSEEGVITDYQKGKVYKITSPHIDKVYVGSTCLTIEQRLLRHENDYNRYTTDNIKYDYISSFEMIKLIDYDIELIEDYPCNNRTELLTRERYYYDMLDHVNIRPPILTDDERKAKRTELMKNYRILNKDDLREYDKNYREKNKEAVTARDKINNKKYREKNPEKVKEYRIKYVTENKEKLKEGQKKHYQENAGPIKEKVKIYRENNKEELKIKEKAYREANREQINARRKIQRENNKDKKREIDRLYRENNKEKLKEKNKIYNQKIKEKKALELQNKNIDI